MSLTAVELVLKVGSGSVGPHSITGKLVYLQDGNEVEVLVDKQVYNHQQAKMLQQFLQINQDECSIPRGV